MDKPKSIRIGCSCLSLGKTKGHSYYDLWNVLEQEKPVVVPPETFIRCGHSHFTLTQTKSQKIRKSKIKKLRQISKWFNDVADYLETL